MMPQEVAERLLVSPDCHLAGMEFQNDALTLSSPGQGQSSVPSGLMQAVDRLDSESLFGFVGNFQGMPDRLGISLWHLVEG